MNTAGIRIPAEQVGLADRARKEVFAWRRVGNPEVPATAAARINPERWRCWYGMAELAISTVLACAAKPGAHIREVADPTLERHDFTELLGILNAGRQNWRPIVLGSRLSLRKTSMHTSARVEIQKRLLEAQTHLARWAVQAVRDLEAEAPANGLLYELPALFVPDVGNSFEAEGRVWLPDISLTMPGRWQERAFQTEAGGLVPFSMPDEPR